MDKYLITGASSGIGREVAIRLSARGAKLALHGRTESKLAEVAAACSGAASIESIASDLTAPHAAEALVATANESMGGIDCVIHCAGIGLIKPASDTTDAEFSKIVNTNLRGTFFTAQAVAAGMIKNGYGRIINVGSVTCVAGYAGLAPYGASRGGVKQLTMSLADDWGKHGITVNCLAPGWFRTDQNKVMYENPEWVRYLCDRIPLKRPGQPGDLDAPVVFLASEGSCYVTGQTLLVDGGISTGATKATVS
jgi:gluconate 5-dehydrogenase